MKCELRGTWQSRVARILNCGRKLPVPIEVMLRLFGRGRPTDSERLERHQLQQGKRRVVVRRHPSIDEQAIAVGIDPLFGRSHQPFLNDGQYPHDPGLLRRSCDMVG